MVLAPTESGAKAKADTEKINDELATLSSDHNWPKRKEIIKKAVEDGIHPDKLGDNLSTPLYQTLSHDPDNSEFLDFLLKHKANPNQTDASGDPVFMSAKTPAAAQLLWEHGGQETVQNHGAQLLFHAACPYGKNYDPALITWYINKGVPVDSACEGETALHNVVFKSDEYHDNAEDALTRINLLLREGALLGTTISKNWHGLRDYNTPQIIKHTIKDAERDLQNSQKYEISHESEISRNISSKRLTFATQIKETLITFSHYRHSGIIVDLEQVGITKVLCTLIASYYVAQEPSYEELENMPLPQKDQDGAQALSFRERGYFFDFQGEM